MLFRHFKEISPKEQYDRSIIGTLFSVFILLVLFITEQFPPWFNLSVAAVLLPLSFIDTYRKYRKKSK